MSELPPLVAKAAEGLLEAIQARQTAEDSQAFVRARAREVVLADRLHGALVEAAFAHRAGDFEALHPRDRLGRWMEKLDSSLHSAVIAANRRKGKVGRSYGKKLIQDIRNQEAGRELATAFASMDVLQTKVSLKEPKGKNFTDDQVVSVSGIGLARYRHPSRVNPDKHVVERVVTRRPGEPRTVTSMHTAFELSPYDGPTGQASLPPSRAQVAKQAKERQKLEGDFARRASRMSPEEYASKAKRLRDLGGEPPGRMPMLRESKIRALVASGMAESRAQAREVLLDLGE